MNPYLPKLTITADLEADLARFNGGVDRAKRAYYGADAADDDYSRRIAASEKQMRYQRRRKEAGR